VSTRYKQLIDDWREAAARTRERQRLLNIAFDEHIAGGPEPSEEDVAALSELRQIEADKLEEAMDYLRRTSTGGPSTPGELR
jgi:hypothetical protein